MSLATPASVQKLQTALHAKAKESPSFRYCEPLRHPKRPGLALASCQLIPTAITAGASRVASDPLRLHAVATTPAGPMERIRSYGSIHVGLPQITDGSAPALSVSRPAQRSLALRPACVLSRLSRPFFIGVFQRNLLPPLTAPTASGWNDQLPGGTLTHWRSPSLHGTPESMDRYPLVSFGSDWRL